MTTLFYTSVGEKRSFAETPFLQGHPGDRSQGLDTRLASDVALSVSGVGVQVYSKPTQSEAGRQLAFAQTLSGGDRRRQAADNTPASQHVGQKGKRTNTMKQRQTFPPFKPQVTTPMLRCGKKRTISLRSCMWPVPRKNRELKRCRAKTITMSQTMCASAQCAKLMTN